MKDKLKGGRADNLPDKSFEKKELNKGKEHEKEHTKDPSIAKEIAKDHIKEDPKYYEKLEAIEGDKKKAPLDKAGQKVYNEDQPARTAPRKSLKIKLVKSVTESSVMASGAVSMAPTFQEEDK